MVNTPPTGSRLKADDETISEIVADIRVPTEGNAALKHQNAIKPVSLCSLAITKIVLNVVALRLLYYGSNWWSWWENPLVRKLCPRKVGGFQQCISIRYIAVLGIWLPSWGPFCLPLWACFHPLYRGTWYLTGLWVPNQYCRPSFHPLYRGTWYLTCWLLAL